MENVGQCVCIGLVNVGHGLVDHIQTLLQIGNEVNNDNINNNGISINFL